tara:strand:+ start:671 stop:943 length:273 start_codon:yes stop_codon:yes gene_type:complete
MKTRLALATLFFFIFSTFVYSDEKDCTDFKKFSTKYFKCKGNLIKEKTISAGQNIIKDTKDYQNKSWSDEKKKMIKTKEKLNKAKEKVLN